MQQAGGEGEKKRDSENIIWCIFNVFLQTVIHPSSNHLESTSHASTRHEQSYLRGFTRELRRWSCCEGSVLPIPSPWPPTPAPLWSETSPISTDNKGSKTINVSLLVQRDQWAQTEAEGRSSSEAVRKGSDTAPFGILKLPRINTAISQELPTTQLLLNRAFS